MLADALASASFLTLAALIDTARVDYMASELRTAPVTPATGVFDTHNGRETRDAEDTPPARWLSRALLYRQGSLHFPVDVDLVLESGRRVRHRWEEKQRWTTIEHEGPEQAVAVEIDPDVRVLIDDNLMNNAARASRSVPWRILERATYVAELGLGAFGP
jgi:hypothetical protein